MGRPLNSRATAGLALEMVVIKEERGASDCDCEPSAAGVLHTPFRCRARRERYLRSYVLDSSGEKRLLKT